VDQKACPSCREDVAGERRRLARDLHDEVGHDLVVLKMCLAALGAGLRGAPRPELERRVAAAGELAGRALESVRRLIFDLGPAALERSGLRSAFERHARLISARTGLAVRVRADGAPRDVPPAHAAALLRVLQGALSNVLEHAKARTVEVSLAARPGAIHLTVEDDGRGFDPRAAHPAFGLAAMRDRVEGLGGRFRVTSRRAGGPGRPRTRIAVALPLSSRGRR
jgi:signal transduction histidine kinase